MALASTDRVNAIYAAVSSANPNFSKLSAAEQTALKNGISTVFATDLTYLVANTQVSTSSTILTGSITTAGSPTTQTGPAAPVSVSGTGTIG